MSTQDLVTNIGILIAQKHSDEAVELLLDALGLPSSESSFEFAKIILEREYPFNIDTRLLKYE